MKKITLLIALLLSAMLSGYAQQVQAYSRTVLTGQTYTPITGGTVINTVAGLTPGFLSTSQDDGGVIVTLPFTFTYGGNTFTQATFTTNGWVGMGNQSTVTAAESRTPGNLFSTTAPNNMLAPWFGDLGGNFPQGPGKMVHGSVGTDVYAFEWSNVTGQTYTQTNATISFMVKIYGPLSATPGRIEFIYGPTVGPVRGSNTSATRNIGIEGATGGVGNFINAVNGSSHLTTAATAFPGSGNGYRFDPVTFSCTAPTGGTIVGGPSIFACSNTTPATIMTTGATPPVAGVTYQWQQSADSGATWANVTGGTGATTPNYTPGTFNGTAIQYRLKVTCGTLEGFSEVASLTAGGTPTIQASGLMVEASQAGGIILNWTNGNGARRVVLASTTPIVDPADGTGPALTVATALVSTGAQQVLFDGTGSTVTATGIPCAGGTYYIKVYEVLRCGTAAPYTYYYNTVGTSANTATVVVPGDATAPVGQASGLTVVNNNGGFAISWAPGTGTRRSVYVSTSPIVDPVSGPGGALTATTAYSGSGQQLVYDGTGTTTSVTVTGIPCATAGTYYVKIYEYDRCGTAPSYTYAYNTTVGTNAKEHIREGNAAPTTQASGLVLTKGVGSFTAYWTNGSSERRVVYVSQSPITAPADGTGPVLTANASLGTGTDPWLVYDGTGSSVTVTNVPCGGGTYYVQVFEYNRCGTAAPYTYSYNTTTGTNAASIVMDLAGPTSQATNLTVTNAPGSFTANFSRGNGNRVMVVVSDTPIFDPLDSTGEPALDAAAAYAGGQQIVYDGTGTSVTVTGIPCSDATYYIKVYEYNRCGSAAPYDYAYNVTSGSNAFTNNVTFAAPTTQATTLTVTNAATSAVLAWTNGNGTRRRVVVSDMPITNPVDEFGVAEITGSANYQGGQQNVYDGTAATVTVTGLTCNTSYFVKVYEYFRCGTTDNYSYVYNVTTGTNAGTIQTSPPPTAVALPQSTSFTGFTGANLTTVSPGWTEAAIPTVGGNPPSSSNPGGTASLWVQSSTAQTTALGKITAKINLYTATRNEWIISPRMNVTAASRLKFKAAMTDYNNGNAIHTSSIDGMQNSDDKVTVLISSDPCGGQWTPIYEFNSTNVITNELTQFEFPIDASYIGQAVYVAFQATDGPIDDTVVVGATTNNVDYDFHITDVIIELVPLCDVPNAISDAASLITNNGATVAWSAPATGTPAGYQYVFSTTNTAPTTAGTDTVNPSATSTTLLASTQYYTWVRTTCDGPIYSNWVMVGSFFTLCDIFPVPFTEAFTAGTQPNCWTNAASVTGAVNLWKFAGFVQGTDYATGNTRPTGTFAWVDGSTPNAPDVTLTTPVLNTATLTVPELSFDYFSNNTTVNLNNIFTAQVKGTAGVWETVYTNNTSQATWREIVIQLTQFVGQNIQVRFVVDKGPAAGNSFYNDILLDNVSVHEAPTCFAPTVSVGTITKNSAVVNMTAPVIAPSEGYQVYYTTSSVAPTASTVPNGGSTTGLTQPISGLDSSTKYYVYARGNCGTTNGVSEWSLVATFTTLCDYPNILTTTPATVCGQGTATIAATSSAGQLYWYTAETGGTLLGTGNSIVTPSVNTTTNFYVSAAQPAPNTTIVSGPGLTTSATYSNPFYSAWSNTHTQHIIKASELQALGMSAGPIASVALDITAAGTLPMIDLSLKIGTTTAADMTAFVSTSGFETVYTNASLMPVAGLNTLVFTTPYTWDGTSNLVLDFCHGNGSSTATMARTAKMDATTYVSSIKAQVSAATAASAICGDTSTQVLTYSTRPQFTFNAVGLCASIRQAVAVNVNPAPAITAGASQATICPGQNSNLTVTSDNTDYTYTWMPGNLTGATHTVTPTTTTTYTVTATDTVLGCVSTKTVVVTVNALPLPIVVTPTAGAICPGGSVALSIPAGPQEKTFGTGTNVNTTSTYPAPYSTYFGGTKHQMLYRASELTAMGFVAGSSITKIGFMISSVGTSFTGTLNDFSISMGHTTNTVLNSTAFIGGLSTVLPAAAATIPTTGLPATVTHTLATPFVWNGTDNIVVQTAYSNNMLGTVNHAVIMFSSNAGFVSTNWYSADNVGVNTILSGATPSSSGTGRPNTIFTVDNPSTLTWSPADGLNTTTGGSVIASPTATTTYTVTSTNPAGCTVTANVTVTVNGANTPTGATSQTISVNSPAEATIEAIAVTETGVKWFATEAQAIAGTPALPAGTPLVVGTTYYGTLSTGSCVPLAVLITDILGSKGFNKSQFTYYPNPVKDVLNLKYSNNISSVEVYNLLGQVVISKKVDATETTVDMSRIADGNYIVRVSSADSVEILKIVKKQ